MGNQIHGTLTPRVEPWHNSKTSSKTTIRRQDSSTFPDDIIISSSPGINAPVIPLVMHLRINNDPVHISSNIASVYTLFFFFFKYPGPPEIFPFPPPRPSPN